MAAEPLTLAVTTYLLWCVPEQSIQYKHIPRPSTCYKVYESKARCIKARDKVSGIWYPTCHPTDRYNSRPITLHP